MRILPLLPDHADPASWPGLRDAELAWSGSPHPGWAQGLHRGLGIHALHLGAGRWDEGLVARGAEALAARLGADFLVIPADLPEGRMALSRFMGALTALLEASHARGVKLALRPAPGAAVGLAKLLKEVRGEAVGFCWDAAVGADLEALSDRLFCAVGGGSEDLAPLQRLGYRWNLALPGTDPAAFAEAKTRLESTFPGVLFPAEMPTHALGRPVLPDEGVTFGRGWGQR